MDINTPISHGADPTQLWEENAETWTELVQQGFDVYRDHLNTPAFMGMLPEVKGLRGLDIGCGEGHNTRLIAERGAQMVAIDVSPTFIYHAKKAEKRTPLGIRYEVGNALSLPFLEDSSDFIVSTMTLMQFKELDIALQEAFRVLKPGGFFQFSITYPSKERLRWHQLDDGTLNVEIVDDQRLEGEVIEWTFDSLPPSLTSRVKKFRTIFFRYTLQYWTGLLRETGFDIETMHDPHPDAETVKIYPFMAKAQVSSQFLHVHCRKPVR